MAKVWEVVLPFSILDRTDLVAAAWLQFSDRLKAHENGSCHSTKGPELIDEKTEV